MLIVNSYDNILPAAYASVFSDAGLDSVAYAPTNATVAASAWPTLGDMISSGKRLVVFLTTRADYQEVPYLIDGMPFPSIRCLSRCAHVPRVCRRVYEHLGDGIRRHDDV